MFASVPDLLSFLDQSIYSVASRAPHRLDPSKLDKSAMECVVRAKQAGYIAVTRCKEPPSENHFDISLTPEGLIEILFSGKRAA